MEKIKPEEQNSECYRRLIHLLFSQQHSLIASDKARKEIGVFLIMLIEIKQNKKYIQ